jgi:hypothetical protein
VRTRNRTLGDSTHHVRLVLVNLGCKASEKLLDLQDINQHNSFMAVVDILDRTSLQRE